MQLHRTSVSLTVKCHKITCFGKRMILVIYLCMTSMIQSNTLSRLMGRIKLTRRRTRTKSENTSTLPITMPKSTPTMSLLDRDASSLEPMSYHYLLIVFSTLFSKSISRLSKSKSNVTGGYMTRPAFIRLHPPSYNFIPIYCHDKMTRN